ncbi:hypothetical protein B0H11DRAFT_2013786 [Mycena galericulata]|nr:hypothetical protein B0H11DRAFT_2013786 [Mycena galericulata]
MNAGSHTTEGSSSQLFVENEISIKFYVDPDVLSRPRLIRTLKSAGASIVTDPKSADLLLVQSDTASGQHFVRVWRAEKTVLEAAWVSTTLLAGRLLKESDQWGGCLAIENHSMDLEELEPHHSLPTPRITPEENNGPSYGPLPYSSQHPPPDSRQSTPQLPLNAPVYSNNNNPPASIQQPILQMPQFAPQQPGMQQPFYSYQMPPHIPAGIVFDPNAYASAFVDILRNQGLLPPWNGPPPQGLGVQNGIPPALFPQGMNPVMNGIQHPLMYSRPPGLIPVTHDQSRSPSVSDPLLPSLSRRSSADVKGKSKAASSRAVASLSTSVNNIFTSKSGVPYSFYVAIEVHKRADILSNIKKHGGLISTQTTADFGVLSFRSKDFLVLLETFISSNGTAVKPAFVLDSVEQNMLLDPSQYQFELPEKLQRKAQKSAPPSPTKTDAAKKQTAASSRKAKPRKVRKEVAVKEEIDGPSLSRPHVRSPTPPGVHTRVLLNGDKYRYPEVETEYVRSYVSVLLSRDHQMSLAAISGKLYKKMPHHSANAWNQYISQTMREDIDAIRKRAIIAYRKEQHQQSQQASAQEPPAKRKKTAEPAASREAEVVTEDLEEQDLNTVAHFFANGGDADQTDDEDESVKDGIDEEEAAKKKAAKDARVWARLTQQTPCRTEPSWERFYNMHHTRVMELYEMLVTAQEEAPPAPLE